MILKSAGTSDWLEYFTKMIVIGCYGARVIIVIIIVKDRQSLQNTCSFVCTEASYQIQNVIDIRRFRQFPEAYYRDINGFTILMICKKHEGKPYALPASPPLPDFRIQQQPPFTSTRVDFAGPLYVKDSKKGKTLAKPGSPFTHAQSQEFYT